MRDKRSRKRILSILLACLMILNVPLSALAAENIQAMDVEMLSDEALPAGEEPMMDQADAADAAGPDAVVEDAAASEEADILEDDGLSEDGVSESVGGIETPAEGAGEESVSETADEGAALVIESVEEVEELLADGEEGDGAEPADSVDVTVTISDAGDLVMMRQSVTVSDYDKDGSLDVDDALYAAHEAAYEGGAAAGYACGITEYGLSLQKLWGDESGCFGYWLNDSACNSLADEIEAGDDLVAFIYQDQTGWSDAYARFGSKEYTAAAEDALTVSVEKARYSTEDARYVLEPFESPALTAYDSSHAKLSTEDYSVDGCNVTFHESGTYYLAATGTENTILVPAVAKVTVEEKPDSAITGITLDKTKASVMAGAAVTLTAAVEPEDAAEGVAVSWSTSDPGVATVEDGVVTGVAAGSAVITASVGAFSAQCEVTVTALPRFSNLEFYGSSSEYNNGEKALELTPEYDPDTYSYSVVAPDYLSGLYTVATLTEETAANGGYGFIMFSNSWGGWSGTAAKNGVAKQTAAISNGSVSVYFSNARAYKYEAKVVPYTTLKGLEIDGVVDAAFNRDLTSYHAYVDSKEDGVDITPTPYKSTYTVTVNGEAVTGGEACHLPYSWNEEGKMEVPITLSMDGCNPTTYTVELEKMPLEDAPFILTQPSEAAYIVGDAAQELTVVASASGSMTYQWYANTEDSNEGGTAIEGAAEAAYTPATEEPGTVYYYCEITNTDTGTVTASDAAKVAVYPDPTPTARIVNAGTAMPEDGYEYGWHTGYLYQVGEEAQPLKVEATSAAEGGEYSYRWIKGSTLNGHSGAIVGSEASYTPSTALDVANTAGSYYVCRVSYKFNGKTYNTYATTGETYTTGEGEEAVTKDVESVYVFVKTDAAAEPTILQQPVGASYVEGDAAAALSVSAMKADAGILSYQWYENDTDSTEGGTAIEGAASSRYALGTVSEPGTKYYYCVVTNTNQGHTSSVASETAEIVVKSLAGLIGDKLKGSGTKEDPYQIMDAQAYQNVADLVAQGVSFEDCYFKQMENITLPEGWKPIGVTKNGSNNIQSGANLNAFSGILDGNGKTVTVPAGGLPLLGYVKGAEVRDLNIYGEKIAGYGLVNNFEGVGLSGSAIIIENVTLKSGSSTLKSGLLGANITTNGFAGCSAGFVATVRNCTIESGVVIGYERDQSMIGSIAGRMQGTVENCVSYATVYGTNYVGGIIGTRDNAMGTCSVSGCEFYGTVDASGQHAGGIVGGGYSNSTAPNGGIPVIQNCSSSGIISGADKVGGILGGDSFVAQLWGTWTFRNNSFTGKVTATDGSYAGGVIGFLNSLNKYDDIGNNYFSTDCGTTKGIGFVQYVDTNCAAHETASGATYFNTENNTDGCPSVSGCSWRTGHNRTDDPLGADADKLISTKPLEVHVTELEISGEYKNQYCIGDELDFTGIKFIAHYSDGTDKNVTSDELTVTGYDNTVRGEQKVTLSYEGASVEITVTVLKQPSDEPIKVTFTLLGDTLHEEDGSCHTLAAGNLTEWIPATVYAVDVNATVYDVLLMAAEKHGFTVLARETEYGTYVYGIKYGDIKLEEFDNGSNSGWMDTINGKHPEVGFAKQYLEDGDAIVVHYTDDYTKENQDEDAEKVEAVKEIITALPSADQITLADQDAVKAARAAYEALTDEQKEQLPLRVLRQLEEAEARIADLLHVHSWDAGKVTKAATCTTAGVKTYTCTCGETKTETIPATGHSFGAWTTAAAATVFAAETQTRTCSVCGAKETRAYGTKLTPTIKVTASTVKLKTGQSTSKFKVSGLAAGDYVKSWKVSNTKLVKVSGKNSGSCKLKAKKKTGKTTLTITLASGLKKKVTVKVQKPAVKTTKITGVTKKVTLKKGKTLKLSPVVSPFTSKQKVTYKSSNKKVAKVTASGKIKALKKGTATITVKSGSVTVKCRVKVK